MKRHSHARALATRGKFARYNLMEWFTDKPTIIEQPMRPVEQRWICPCGGEMKSTGQAWMTNPPGHFHQCDKCSYAAAMSAVKYPCIVFVAVEKKL